MRQRSKQCQIISHLRLIDIDHILLCVIDSRDHVKCRTQVLFHRLRHIFHLQSRVRILRKRRTDPLPKFAQDELCIALPHGRRRLLGFSPGDPYDTLHGLQILHDLPPRQVFQLPHGLLRPRRLAHDHLIIRLSLRQIAQPFLVLSCPFQLFHRGEQSLVRRIDTVLHHQRVVFYIIALFLFRQLIQPGYAVGECRIQIIAVPHLEERAALFDHRICRIIRHEQSRL